MLIDLHVWHWPFIKQGSAQGVDWEPDVALCHACCHKVSGHNCIVTGIGASSSVECKNKNLKETVFFAM